MHFQQQELLRLEPALELGLVRELAPQGEPVEPGLEQVLEQQVARRELVPQELVLEQVVQRAELQPPSSRKPRIRR